MAYWMWLKWRKGRTHDVSSHAVTKVFFLQKQQAWEPGKAEGREVKATK